MNAGGQAIDAAVAAAFLAALPPAALQACLQAAEQLEHGHDAALDQHRRQVEQARYQAARAERRYRAVDPENRLVARGLETEWNTALQRARRRRSRARPPRDRPPEGPHPGGAGGDPGPRRRPRPGLGRARPPPTRTASSCCAPCSTR